MIIPVELVADDQKRRHLWRVANKFADNCIGAVLTRAATAAACGGVQSSTPKRVGKPPHDLLLPVSDERGGTHHDSFSAAVSDEGPDHGQTSQTTRAWYGSSTQLVW